MIASARAEAIGPATVRRVGVRLVWFLILLYVLNNIDRTNVGFATLTMSRAIGLTPRTLGISIGVFYLGYLLCEIPSNVAFARFGARTSLARMAIVSGLVTIATALVVGPRSFYALRFLLGVAEAGYLPGIVYYLSLWFPRAYRARVNALFMLSLPLAFTLSSAVAGSILALDGTWGIAGWQWLFIIEGAPALLAGFASLVYLADRPAGAAWLRPAEREWLCATLAAEASAPSLHGSPARQGRAPGRSPFLSVLGNRVVLTCAAVYWGLNFGLITLTSWTPTVIRTFGLPTSEVGYVSMIAPLVGAVVMLLWCRASDRSGERVINTAAALLVGAAGWALAALAGTPLLVIAAFVLAASGVYATYAISFAIAQTYVAPADRPVAIAIVGVLGNVGGVLTPIIVGYSRQLTHSFTAGFLVTAAMMAIGAVVTLTLRSHLAASGRAPDAAGGIARDAPAAPGAVDV